jgi:Uma2 family endonuclease
VVTGVRSSSPAEGADRREHAFEPDVVVSGVEVPEGLLVPEPLIVVEVLSESTRDRDFTIKLAGYASLTSVVHYLLVEMRRRLIVHHHRPAGEPEFRTSIARGGILRLDPPGLDLDLDAIYGASGIGPHRARQQR